MRNQSLLDRLKKFEERVKGFGPAVPGALRAGLSEEVKALFKAGVGSSELAKVLGVSRSSVYSWIRESVAPRKKPRGRVIQHLEVASLAPKAPVLKLSSPIVEVLGDRVRISFAEGL